MAALGSGADLTARIAALERMVEDQSRNELAGLLAEEAISDDILRAAVLIKGVAGQINVIIHAVGILVSLPHILDEDEVVQSLSLGAGNTGRPHDLETDRRIAEFKFIEWRGGSESIRQNNLFADVFNLASARTSKRRVVYVVGKEQPLRFLGNQRALASVLSKNAAVERRFREAHGEQFRTVREYWESTKHLVEIVDLSELVPAFAPFE